MAGSLFGDHSGAAATPAAGLASILGHKSGDLLVEGDSLTDWVCEARVCTVRAVKRAVRASSVETSMVERRHDEWDIDAWTQAFQTQVDSSSVASSR
jgi:hypothetical protein